MLRLRDFSGVRMADIMRVIIVGEPMLSIKSYHGGDGLTQLLDSRTVVLATSLHLPKICFDMDIVDRATRSRIMSAIRPKDTKPELRLRRALHAAGLRFRLHNHSLPGRPDMLFASKRTIVFVHGCFWHRHSCPKGRSNPASNVAFWQTKFEATVSRDAKNLAILAAHGWRVIVVWECQITDRYISDLALKIRHGKGVVPLPGEIRSSTIRNRQDLMVCSTKP